MDHSITKTLNNAILKLLRPLVRILLRNGISYHVFSDLVRWVYVDVAFKSFDIPGRKQTSSRVSVITGLSRKEVQQTLPLSRLTFQGGNRHHLGFQLLQVYLARKCRGCVLLRYR